MAMRLTSRYTSNRNNITSHHIYLKNRINFITKVVSLHYELRCFFNLRSCFYDMKKKIISYLYTKQKRAVLLRAFHIWQHRPYEVAPLSDVSHKCTSCGTEYTGNFCPRCGQSAKIGRFSFKKAILHFLDVWGVGNRSMFRTIRD